MSAGLGLPGPRPGIPSPRPAGSPQIPAGSHPASHLDDSEWWKIVEDGNAIEVPELDVTGFQLGPILRKYCAAKMSVKGSKRSTSVEFSLLYDAIGLLRSLVYDLHQYNSIIDAEDVSASELRYRAFRLTRQASAFGVRLPRAGSGTGRTVSAPGLHELLSLVERRYENAIATARSIISGGVVDFPSLSEFYRPGLDVVDRGVATGIFGVPTAMRVRASYYSRGKSMFGTISTFYVALEFVVAVEDRFAVVETAFPIGEYSGTRSTSEGLENFIVLTEPMKKELMQRGHMYASMASACSYLEYAPGSFLPSPKPGVNGIARTAARARGGGRVMIDSSAAWSRGVHCARSEGVASDAVKGVLKLVAQRAKTAARPKESSTAPDATAYTAGSGGQTASTEEENMDLLLLSAPLPDTLHCLTWPVVPGFSFHSKSWGVVMVSGLSPVHFNEQAFQRLVMPPQRKKLIEALVLNHHSTRQGDASVSSAQAYTKAKTDVIAGKGEGSIFLLYGPPGVGKTLTAEAIAEMLHKPLYVVSMGELGTSPEALEERLLDILDLCVPWGALVLIDEAEMLLERRSKNDIVRNAMVCVMLRLLEYYTGILFLTTNRVESLDPAFQSRVQCALRYDSLTAESRAAIWTDILKYVPQGEGTDAVQVHSDVDVQELAAHELNGRQIKNVVQLALALARHEAPTSTTGSGGCQLSMRHLRTTVDITTAFISETQEGS